MLVAVQGFNLKLHPTQRERVNSGMNFSEGRWPIYIASEQIAIRLLTVEILTNVTVDSNDHISNSHSLKNKTHSKFEQQKVTKFALTRSLVASVQIAK